MSVAAKIRKAKKIALTDKTATSHMPRRLFVNIFLITGASVFASSMACKSAGMKIPSFGLLCVRAACLSMKDLAPH